AEPEPVRVDADRELVVGKDAGSGPQRVGHFRVVARAFPVVLDVANPSQIGLALEPEQPRRCGKPGETRNRHGRDLEESEQQERNGGIEQDHRNGDAAPPRTLPRPSCYPHDPSDLSVIAARVYRFARSRFDPRLDYASAISPARARRSSSMSWSTSEVVLVS